MFLMKNAPLRCASAAQARVNQNINAWGKSWIPLPIERYVMVRCLVEPTANRVLAEAPLLEPLSCPGG